MNNDVSIILPVYNAEKYIKKSIDSILNQTYKSFELIIINDGSIDSSEDIILSYKDERIKYIKNIKNIGLIASLNKGISFSDAEYIVRMDADDICRLKRLDVQIKYLKENKSIGVLGSFAKSFGLDVHSKLMKRPINDSDIKMKMFIDSPFIHPSVVIKRDLLIKYGGYDDRFFRVEDYGLWVKLSKFTTFANLPLVLLDYRIVSNSETRLSQSDRMKRHESLKEVFKLLFDNNNLNFTDSEIDQYTYSMFRANFDMIDVKLLKKVYEIILEELKLINLYNEFSKRWIAIFMLRKSLIIKYFPVFILSKLTYSGFLFVLKDKLNRR